MTARLVALVMLPVTALCMLVGSVVVSHRSLATKAGDVENGVIGLSHLVTLADSLSDQKAIEAFDVRFEQIGVTRAIASSYLGFDLTAQVAPARAQADRAVASLGSVSPVDAGALRTVYARIDAGMISATVAVEDLAGFIAASDNAVVSGLERLEAEVDDPDLMAALESLRTASGLHRFAIPQVVDLSEIWFPAHGDTAQTAAAALTRFGAESAGYSAAVEGLRELGVKGVVAAVDRIEADPGVRDFNLSVAATVRGEPLGAAGAPLDTVKIATTFNGYFARDRMLDGLVATATTAVRDEARRVAATEHTSFVTWALAAASVAVASLGVALLLARSISRPLKRLARYAHAVNDGQLDARAAAVRKHGPRETRVVFQAFADLVANLQLLDAKTNALALCKFDDPVLRQPLPGRLGRSLESSVALLSGSIVERDELQTHLAFAATHDALTGISNRPAALTEMQAAMSRSVRTGATTALLFIDLNDFKAVNDSHGHEVGDEVLRQVAARLTADLREADFVARLGGDEFVVVAEGVADVSEATQLARRVIDAITRPFEIDGLRIAVGAAVGIAMCLDGPEEPLRLLARADAAMYRAKRHDRSAIEIFDADLQQQLLEREDIETALTAALADPTGGGLVLQYQPILKAGSGVLCAVEALIRWDRPGHGRLPPNSFIPIAEATSLIIDLDRWVLAQATRQMVEWSVVPELVGIRVSVNISGRHLLSGHLPEHIREVLEEFGIKPQRLAIEITETVLLSDLVAAAAELAAVRALGVSVAIDDFGTGYTSLAHLQQLPIDTIKIDRSFICQLHARRGRSLVRMVTDLGHAIDLKIVAEGVETADELNELEAMGADYLQGFFLSRPMAPAALSVWARERVAVLPQPSVPAA